MSLILSRLSLRIRIFFSSQQPPSSHDREKQVKGHAKQRAGQ